MGKKRFTRQNSIKILEIQDAVKINQTENGKIFFEFYNHITDDVAEAVAMMMRTDGIDKKLWEVELEFDLDLIQPRKTLYWLSGGDREWIKLTNYKKPWCEVESYYEYEYDHIIRWIVKKSKNLSEIRDKFIQYLNLPTLYEFALSKNFVR